MNRIPTIADVLMSRHESGDIYTCDTPEQLGTIQAADAIMIDDKIVTREDVRKLQQERNELAAQVESLRVAWEAVKATDWDKPLEEVFAATPQQHLRDVEAEAGRAGFIAGWQAGCLYADSLVSTPDGEAADNYADQIRQEGD